MVPQQCLVAAFVQFADKIFCVLSGDIQSYLGQIQVRADATGGTNLGDTEDICHDAQSQFAGRDVVQFQIVSHIHESFVDGVHMDVFFGNIVQIDTVNIGGGIDIFLHTGRGNGILYMLRNLKKAAAILDAKGLHGRRDGKADRLLGAFRIGYNQIFSHGIQTPGHTFHGSVEGFQIDT